MVVPLLTVSWIDMNKLALIIMINNKTEAFEKASENVDKLEDEANENVNKMKDVEKSSEPIGWIK